MVSNAGERFVCETSAVLMAKRDGRARTRHAIEARAEWRHKLGRTGWSVPDVAFMASLFGIFILNMLDITITLIHTTAVGWVAEGNPLIRVMAEVGGALLPTVFKVVIIVTAMLVMWRLYRQTQVAMASARTTEGRKRAAFVLRAQIVATGILFALYAWIVQHNMRITWL